MARHGFLYRIVNLRFRSNLGGKLFFLFGSIGVTAVLFGGVFTPYALGFKEYSKKPHVTYPLWYLEEKEKQKRIQESQHHQN